MEVRSFDSSYILSAPSAEFIACSFTPLATSSTALATSLRDALVSSEALDSMIDVSCTFIDESLTFNTSIEIFSTI